jgi:hypothetical protein
MSPESSTGIPDFAIENGELCIRSGDWEIRICGWPMPRARHRRRSSPWQESRPEFRLLRPEHEAAEYELTHTGAQDNSKLANFRLFRNTIPVAVVGAVERFQSHQFNMIDLLSKEQAALDLAASNPALFYCTGNNDQFRKLLAPSPAEAARKQICRRQKQILAWLEFPSSESMVRILRKVLPEAVTPHDLRVLRQAIQSDPEVARRIPHLPAINSSVLGLVGNLKLFAAASPRLLTRVAEAEEERTSSRTADLLVDSLYMLRNAGIRWKAPRFDSIQAVREFHDRVAVEWQRILTAPPPERRPQPAKKRAAPQRKFPQPPIPGTEDILPLASEQALRAEGKIQANCVASYASKVRNGALYIYRVLRPERATLSITLGPDGCWHRGELELYKNRGIASNATRHAVDEWLYLHSLSA